MQSNCVQIKIIRLNFTFVVFSRQTLQISGAVYNEIKRNHKDLLSNVLLSASVYARMSPMDKSMLMEDLKEIGYSVGMLQTLFKQNIVVSYKVPRSIYF